ncbi:DJ-1/PfpI family protein, partial [Actinocorallia lasiicapitis]
MRHRVVALLGPATELYPVTCASAVFGWHGTEIPHHYELRTCTERPGRITTTLGSDLVVEHGLAALAEADTVLIAGWCARPDSPAVLEAVGAAHARGARIVAVCEGVWIPAALGLLDGRTSASHWDLVDQLSAAYPRVRFDSKILYVDHGDVATAGASATTLDLCLSLVRRDHGAALAARIGR